MKYWFALCAVTSLLSPLLLALAPALAAAAQQDDSHRHHSPPPTQHDAGSVQSLSIPDVRMVTQEGKAVSFFTDLVEGRLVAMNFIFTTCTTICAPMGATFSRLQDLLGERAGRDVHLISVSVDPVTDTPERLEAWGQRFGAGPGWTLVTGEKADVDWLLKSLQVFTPDFADHSPTVLVGNEPAGSWQRAYGLAAPRNLLEIVQELGAAQAGAEGKTGSSP
jgi:protein SCO1/2